MFSVVCLRTLKSHFKLKGVLQNFISVVTCPNQGLLIIITFKHLYYGETVSLRTFHVILYKKYSLSNKNKVIS